MKINKSQIARELEVDRRTVDKYINGYTKPETRNCNDCITPFYDIIAELLSDRNQQVFYYRKVLLLSYSRFMVYRVSISKTQDILFSYLDDAFETFGGVPDEIVTDNMKTVMDEARKDMICEMDYEEITIKELVARAMIDRKTFFLHL